MTETNFSPLEALSLASIADPKARISKLAKLCRDGRFGYKCAYRLRVKDAKKIISLIREPWGERGEVAKALIEELDRQITLTRQRETNQYIALPSRVKDYDPIAAHYAEAPYSLEDRRKAMALRAIADERAILSSRHYWSRYSVSNHAVRDVSFRKNKILMLVEPDWVRTTQGARLEWHKIRYIVYKVDGKVGAVRVNHEARGLTKALESLEPRAVREAREKKFDIQIDWQEEAFRVKSPRRRKARLIPFKRYTRDRG